jgi:phosphotransacetylase
MDLISQIVERAKANKQRIVLPEGTEELPQLSTNIFMMLLFFGE